MHLIFVSAFVPIEMLISSLCYSSTKSLLYVQINIWLWLQLLLITYLWRSHVWCAVMLGACTCQKQQLPIVCPAGHIHIIRACAWLGCVLHFFYLPVELGAQVGKLGFDCRRCMKRKLYIKQECAQSSLLSVPCKWLQCGLHYRQ